MSAQAGAPVPWGPHAFLGSWHSQGAQHRPAPGWCPLCHTRSTDTGLAGISQWPGAQGSSIVSPDAVPHRIWRLLLVQALHSLLGNLPSHNTSPRQEHGTGRSPPCPLTAWACHGPPAACASGLAVCPRAALHLLYTAATPAVSPAAAAAPLPARGAALLPGARAFLLFGSSRVKARKHTQHAGFTSYQKPSRTLLLPPSPAFCRGGRAVGLGAAPSPAPRERRRAGGSLYSPYGASILELSWVLTLTMSRRLLLWAHLGPKPEEVEE